MDSQTIDVKTRPILLIQQEQWKNATGEARIIDSNATGTDATKAIPFKISDKSKDDKLLIKRRFVFEHVLK